MLVHELSFRARLTAVAVHWMGVYLFQGGIENLRRRNKKKKKEVDEEMRTRAAMRFTESEKGPKH